MRTPVFAVLLALCLLYGSGPARADSFFHLPCDPNGSVSVGGGVFTGDTRMEGDEQVAFERVIAGAVRFDLALFDACKRDGQEGPTTGRAWFGRASLFGTLLPERAQLSLRSPATSGAARSTGGNGLSWADLNGGIAVSRGGGLRVSILDRPYFHLEAYFERTGTSGWEDAEIEMIMARVNGTELDVTSFLDRYTKISYRFVLRSYGLTIALPLQKAPLIQRPLTLFVSGGRMNVAVEVVAKPNPGFGEITRTVGVNPDIVTEPHRMKKSSWSGNVGVRFNWDATRSFALSLAHDGKGSTTVDTVFAIFIWDLDIPTLFDSDRIRILSGGCEHCTWPRPVL